MGILNAKITRIALSEVVETDRGCRKPENHLDIEKCEKGLEVFVMSSITYCYNPWHWPDVTNLVVGKSMNS